MWNDIRGSSVDEEMVNGCHSYAPMDCTCMSQYCPGRCANGLPATV